MCQGANCDKQVSLENAFVVDKIPVGNNCIFTKEHALEYAHLRDLDIVSESNPQIDILIGTDNPYPFWCLENRTGLPSEPYAQRSPLGWFIVGVKSNSKDSAANILLTSVREPGHVMSEMCRQDFLDASVFSVKPCPSIEDKEALNLIESSLQLTEKTFSAKLPFKQDPGDSLTCYRESVYKRALALGRKFSQKNLYLFSV